MNQSLTQANFTTSVRYFLTMGISFAAGRGWITSDTAANIGILAVGLLPMLWGWYVNWSKKQAAETQVTQAVRAGVSTALDPTVATLPAAAIGPIEAKSIVAAYAASK